MSNLKSIALERLNEVNGSDAPMDYSDYSVIFDGLTEINTLRDRDKELEELWEQFGDIPMDEETECIEERFLCFEAGTHREVVWTWFDERYSKGVVGLMYGDGIDRTDHLAKLVNLKQLCIGCESCTCQFNHGGECRFALVHERKPRINDVDGCIDYEYSEGET